MKANKLSINYSKTEYLVINKTKLQQNSIKIKIGNEKITQVNKVKYLGVIINQDLSCTLQIDMQCSKIARGIGLWLTSVDLSKSLH